MSKYSLTNRPRVFLKKGKAKPFWYRHPWVFSGAIKDIKGNPENGSVAEVYDSERRFVGKGFFNSHSRIRVRLLSWDLHEKIDAGFFRNKIREAFSLRETTLALPQKTSAYRLIHGEGDGLPGLIVDRYNQILAVQFLSAGMDCRRKMILEHLREITGAKTIVERYPARYRRLEGLDEIDYLVHGEKPPEKIYIREYGISFQLSLEKGQKTGFYLDQRENRRRISQMPFRQKVLDAFCYSGAFGIYLLANDSAGEVTFMDSSSFALELVKANLRKNNLSESFPRVKADIFRKLPEMEKQGERFDMIILDPPKVAPDKSSLKRGLHSLKVLNAVALRMLTDHGVLITCDCSGIISQNEFWKMLGEAAKDAERCLKIVDFMGAGADHPILPSCPENSYLKLAVGIVGSW